MLAFVLIMVVAGLLTLNLAFAMQYQRAPRRRAHDALVTKYHDDYVDLSNLPYEQRDKLEDVIRRALDTGTGSRPRTSAI